MKGLNCFGISFFIFFVWVIHPHQPKVRVTFEVSFARCTAILSFYSSPGTSLLNLISLRSTVVVFEARRKLKTFKQNWGGSTRNRRFTTLGGGREEGGGNKNIPLPTIFHSSVATMQRNKGQFHQPTGEWNNKKETEQKRWSSDSNCTSNFCAHFHIIVQFCHEKIYL